MVLASLLSVARDVGYPVLFALVAIETMGIPVPGETAIFTAGILASRDELRIEVVIAVAALAAIIGDNIGFMIGRRLGRRVLLPPGPAGPGGPARAGAVRAPSPPRHRDRRAVLRPAWAEGRVPRAVGRRLADHVGVAGGREPDVVADVPLLERARRHLLGDGGRARRVL